MIGLDANVLVRYLTQDDPARPFVVERADLAWQAKQVFASGKADFADCVIERLGNAAGCEQTVTFDRVAARNAGMRLLESRNA